MSRALRNLTTALVALASACATTSGNTWLTEPAGGSDEEGSRSRASSPAQPGSVPEPERFRTQVIGGDAERRELPRTGQGPKAPLGGSVLGTFRNTYYDFPTEPDFTGDPVSLRDARCGAIAEVPRGFHDAVCVQGSGILKTGRTVSFAKRDCACAEICPKTGQKICFEALDPQKYPWGRGALGTAITPLLTVAVDDSIIPMGKPVYIPEFDGVPVDAAKSALHDGCFIAQDRGLRVKGQHVDIFTGYSAVTALWNQLVPSNHGVTVVLDSPHCARAE
jgi:3D (Asp-Asp-Asp) domain-containing protein